MNYIYRLGMTFKTNGEFGWELNLMPDGGEYFNDKKIYSFSKYYHDREEIRTYTYKLIDLLINNIQGNKDACDDVIHHLLRLKHFLSLNKGDNCSLGTLLCENKKYNVSLELFKVTDINSAFIHKLTDNMEGK